MNDKRTDDHSSAVSVPEPRLSPEAEEDIRRHGNNANGATRPAEIERVERLTLEQQYELVMVAAKTTDPEVKKYALALLAAVS